MIPTPPPLPAQPRKKDPLAVTAMIFGVIGFPLALFCGLLCLLGRDGGFGGPFLVGLLLLILGLLIHLAMAVVAVVAVLKQRSVLTVAGCALNLAVIPLVFLILILALS